MNPTGILIVDNRLAVPSSLRSAVLQWLHKGHPGQRALIDAASYLWWPRMHTNIIETAEKCESCRKFGKNLKTLTSKAGYENLEPLTCPNEELKLDFAGPIQTGKNGSGVYLLVAIDRYSLFPSCMITKSTGSKKIINFLDECILTHGVPRSIKSDQGTGFKTPS